MKIYKYVQLSVNYLKLKKEMLQKNVILTANMSSFAKTKVDKTSLTQNPIYPISCSHMVPSAEGSTDLGIPCDCRQTWNWMKKNPLRHP